MQEFVAAEAPDGFGFPVSIATLSRFYKAHFEEIDRVRHDQLLANSYHHAKQDDDEEDFRYVLHDGITLLLQERIYEVLHQPVDSVEQLKKVVEICRLRKDLDIEMDPRRRFLQREAARDTTEAAALVHHLSQKQMASAGENPPTSENPASP